MQLNVYLCIVVYMYKPHQTCSRLVFVVTAPVCQCVSYFSLLRYSVLWECVVFPMHCYKMTANSCAHARDVGVCVGV